MSNRLEKVNSLLEKEISKIVATDFDFAGGIITLTHVDTTPNLIEARAYVSVLPEDRMDAAIKSLNKEVYGMQKKLNKMLNMRPIPRILFVKDQVVAEAAKIEALIDKAKNQENSTY